MGVTDTANGHPPTALSVAWLGGTADSGKLHYGWRLRLQVHGTGVPYNLQYKYSSAVLIYRTGKKLILRRYSARAI